MSHEDSIRLANIYIKIHNKKTLTMDDLAFLAKYNPECFHKTCQNLIYNMPQSKPLVEPNEVEEQEGLAGKEEREEPSGVKPSGVTPLEAVLLDEKQKGEQIMSTFLTNINRMEKDVLKVQNVDVNEVKNLMGNLFMEMMFPHNDRQSYFDMENSPQSRFNARA